MDTSDRDIVDELNDVIDSALDSVFELILENRSDVMAYDSKGVPIGLTKSNEVSIEKVKDAIIKFKRENRND